LTIKLEPDQAAWLEEQARMAKRSKGTLIRELISQQRAGGNHATWQLADLRGCLSSSKDLSARSLKGYGRR
jgi:Ribbon-helix-helix protein, copG family